MLCVRSLYPSDFGRGAETDAATISADLAVQNGFSLSGSATGARTRSEDQDASLRVGKDGLVSSSFQIAAAKERVFDASDRIRLSLAQPFTTEAGEVQFTSVHVVDRTTGEKGLVTQTIDLSTRSRQYIAELIYGRSMIGGAGELSIFGRAQLRPAETRGTSVHGEDHPAVLGGARFQLSF